VQPLVYLRIRPGKKQKVITALQQADIPFTTISEHCIAVNNNTKADAVLEIDKDVVVQDWSSQRVLEPLHNALLQQPLKVWDCCAASGGKSILLLDTFSDVQLTVSDVREGILHNLRNRFAKAGIKNYQSFIGDASKELPPRNEKFELVICDAPCSGSGTWSRTPEQLHFFSAAKIDYYAGLQKSIVANAYKSIRPGGYLLYITCSVFIKENEEVVDFMQNTLSLKLQESNYYKGYDDKADTLFAALFQV
jgi:16S rRNA (cytosine967-C5)-methyltransferase